MKNCPFCSPELNDRIIETNESAQVFFSNPRLTKGHLLVTPKEHIEEPWGLSEAELTDIFSLIHKYQKLLTSGIGTGCDVKQNYRPFLPQGRLKVDHVHFYLIPRTLNDDLYERSQKFESDIFNDITTEEMKKVLKALSI